MSLATYLRDRLPSAFVRAAALGLVVLALAAYGVESGVLAFVTVAFLAGEATALLLDFWRRRGFYRRLDRTMEGLGEHGVGYLAPELTQEPPTLEEAAFLDALRQASKSMADQVAAMRAEQRDYRDYVETWVHEVKTPIAAGRLVAANNPGPATDAMDAELGRIEGYVEQALYYARSTTLDRDFQVREVVLADVVRAALRRNARTLIDACVTPELGELGLTVSADPKWVEFMLGQLMGNAAKYRREGAEAGHLRLWAERRQTGMDAWETLLFVEDDGVGIPPEDLGRVFDRGFTGANGRLYARSTGMGLYLVRELAGKMGLAVGIDSEQGRWTRVTLAFPASARRTPIGR